MQHQTTIQGIIAIADQYAPDPALLESRSDEIDQILSAEPDAHPALLATALGYGGFMRRAALTHPGTLSRTAWDELHDGPDSVLEHLLDPQNDGPDIASQLRRDRQITWLKIALAQNLKIWSPVQVWQTLSAAAERLVDRALTHCIAEAETRYGSLLLNGQKQTISILAFGKLGVRELNFSSDIDLVFVCSDCRGETSGGTREPVEGRRYFERIATDLMDLLRETTADGFVFRVDVRLRPNGSRGLLVPTVDSCLEYYPNWGSSWERIALIRARPVAGDIPLGSKLLHQLESHIFPNHLDFESIESMRKIKEKIKREALRTDKNAVDLKHGTGGIRELEFLIQNLQIIFGGKRRDLKIRDTLGAIKALAAEALMPPDIAQQLQDAYIFLRHIENCIQARDDRQTYSLPTTPGELAEVARAAGFSGSDPGTELLSELKAHQSIVAQEFSFLYAKNDKHADTLSAEVFELTENEHMTESERQTLLAQCGFQQPQEAGKWIDKIIEGPKARVYGNRAREQFQNTLPVLLDAVVKSDAPDQALPLLLEFIQRIGGRPYLYALLHENPQVIYALVKLFSRSLFLGGLFTRNPELLDLLVLKSHVLPHRTPEQFDEIITIALKNAEAGDDLEEIANVYRRIKQQEQLRIGFHDLAGDLNLLDVQTQLTRLAESLLLHTRGLAFEHLAARYEIDPALANYLIPVALGKLGSRELNYGSDLDLIFITLDPGKLPLELAIRGAQKILSLMHTRTIEGILYEIDMQLRPSGNQGMLVTTLDSFSKYQQSTAAIWERIAFVKARPLGIDQHHAETLQSIIHQTCYLNPLTSEDIDEMARIRARMAEERGEKEPLKTGPGGTVDIEFAIALTQLMFAGELPDLRRTSPLGALHHWKQLPEPFHPVGELFKRALFSYRLLETRLHLLLDRPAARVPQNKSQQYALAKAMGFSDAGHLRQFYDDLAGDVRESYLHTLELLREHLPTSG